jgi:DNA-binding SARP family transcriptional activator
MTADSVPVLHVFDGPYATIGGRRREIPEGSKRLLVFVGLRRRRVERRVAAGRLWPIGDDARASGNLRSALWRLKVAGIDLLSTDKWSLTLGQDVVVDVHSAHDWATRLVRDVPTAEDVAVPPWWPDALDLLPAWYDEWVLMERERLRQRVLHALEALTRRLVRAARYAEAVEAAMTAVSAEPLRESAQRVLIEAHLAEGNWIEARRVYHSYRELLRRELGAEPADSFVADLPLLRRVSSLAGPAPGDSRVTWT